MKREPSPIHPLAFQYKISFEFLRHLGFNKIEDLPNYGELSKPLPSEDSLEEKEGLPAEALAGAEVRQGGTEEAESAAKENL